MELVGREIVVEGTSYRIVEIRRLGAETLVFAEPTMGHALKMALRLEDIADCLVKVGDEGAAAAR